MSLNSYEIFFQIENNKICQYYSSFFHGQIIYLNQVSMRYTYSKSILKLIMLFLYLHAEIKKH